MMMMIFLLLHSCTLWIEISKHVRHSILTYFSIVDFFFDDFSTLLPGSDPIVCPLLTTTQQHHNLFPLPCANIYSPTKRKIIDHFALSRRGQEMEGRTMKAFSHALRSDELKGKQQTSLSLNDNGPPRSFFLLHVHTPTSNDIYNIFHFTLQRRFLSFHCKLSFSNSLLWRNFIQN